MPPLTDRFASYLHQLTGLNVTWIGAAGSRLPAYLRQRYEPHMMTVGQTTWLAVLLRSPEPAPLALVKQLAELASRVDPRPAGTCLVAEQLSPHLRRRMVELEQPFAIPGRQLFWPALGSIETTQRAKRLPPKPVEQLSPAAEQLLIALLLGRLEPPTIISDAAATLGCTAASISQAVKALEASGLVRSERQGRERCFALAAPPKAAWQAALSLLHHPVRRRVRIEAAELPDVPRWRAGESALAELTSLGSPEEPCFAIASRDWTLTKRPVIPTPDVGTCLLELWRYPPGPLADQGRVDRLSLYLSLRDSHDERIQMALDTMMEQTPW